MYMIVVLHCQDLSSLVFFFQRYMPWSNYTVTFFASRTKIQWDVMLDRYMFKGWQAILKIGSIQLYRTYIMLSYISKLYISDISLSYEKCQVVSIPRGACPWGPWGPWGPGTGGCASASSLTPLPRGPSSWLRPGTPLPQGRYLP